MIRNDAWHKLVGPLTRPQSFLVVTSATAAAEEVYRRTRRSGWLPAGVSAAIAGDLIGGLVTFQLAPTRAAYAGTAPRERGRFVALHVHPFALPATGQGGWWVATLRYASTLLATVALETWLPHSSARRVVANLVAGCLSLGDLRLAATEGQRWFGPVFYFKVIGGHAGIPRDHASA